MPRAATPPRLAWASLAPALGACGQPSESSVAAQWLHYSIPGSTPCSRKPRPPTQSWAAQRSHPRSWEAGAGAAGKMPAGKPDRMDNCPGHTRPLSEARLTFPVASRLHEEEGKLLIEGSCPSRLPTALPYYHLFCNMGPSSNSDVLTVVQCIYHRAWHMEGA